MSDKNPENKCKDLSTDVEYNKDALNIMLKMQYELQLFYAKKRNSTTPDSENEHRIKEALYHFNCFTAELWEAEERVNNGITNKDDLKELKMEFVDCWHFLMNMAIYLGCKSTKYSLDYFWASMHGQEFRGSIASISLIWGRILDYLPYKYWKTYDNYDFDKSVVYDLIDSMFFCFINMAKGIGMTKEEFYGMYVAKNQENYNRQIKGY